MEECSIKMKAYCPILSLSSIYLNLINQHGRTKLFHSNSIALLARGGNRAADIQVIGGVGAGGGNEVTGL